MLVALVSKLVGAGVPAYLLGLNATESTAIGIGMSARARWNWSLPTSLYVLACSSIPSRLHQWSHIYSVLFSAIVIVAIVPTIATPVAMQTRCLRVGFALAF